MRQLLFLLILFCPLTAARWQQCPLFTTRDICSIKFVSASDGWVVTTNEIWRTADSGNTWIDCSAPLDSGACFLTTFFLDNKYGWAFSDVAGVQTYYHRTVDGGYSWSKDTISHAASIGRFFFHDSLHGWKASMIIYSTDNGGITWKPQFSPDAYRDRFDAIYFVDRNIGFASGSRMINEQNGVTCTIIYRTLNGGNNWECVYVAEDINNQPVPELHTINFVNHAKGFFLGTQSYTSCLIIEMPTIVSTHDQGNTWNTHELFPRTYDQNFYYNCRCFSFLSDQTGYLVARKYSADSGAVLITENGGNSWKESLLSGSRLYTIQMLSHDDGWCGGEKGVLYHYTDKTVKVAVSPVRQRLPALSCKHATLLNGQCVKDLNAKNRNWRRVVIGRE